MSLAILAIMAAAFAASLIVTVLAWRAGVLDMPNARSSHLNPTPRAGGLGVMAGLGAGALAASAFALSGGPLAGILIIAAAFAVMGFADDLITLGEAGKLIASVCLCIALAAVAGPVTHIPVDGATGISLPVWLGWAGSALFVFVAVNAVNFMDGSDGMLPAVMIPASLGLAVAGLVAGVNASVIAGAALAAALAGFVLFNWNPARVFAGDVGALGVGAAYAGGRAGAGGIWLSRIALAGAALRSGVPGRCAADAAAPGAPRALLAAGPSRACLSAPDRWRMEPRARGGGLWRADGADRPDRACGGARA